VTQPERDAAIRQLRDRLQDAKENRSAVLAELMRYADLLRELLPILDSVPSDYIAQMTEHDVPRGLPSTERLTELLGELRASNEKANECRQLLRDAGYEA